MSTKPRQDQSSVVAVFEQHSAAENAIKDLAAATSMPISPTSLLRGVLATLCSARIAIFSDQDAA